MRAQLGILIIAERRAHDMKGMSRFNPAVMMGAMLSVIADTNASQSAHRQNASSSGSAVHARRGGFVVNNKARRRRKGRPGKGRS